MSNDRRSFLKKAAVFYSGALFIPACKTVGGRMNKAESFLRVSPINSDIPKRVSWSSLSSDDKKAFIDAVRAMKITEITIPSGFGKSEERKGDRWAAQAECHLWYCSHRNWTFLPWHRSYLYFFERYLRKQIRDSFRLPYWDWTQNQELPVELQDSNLVKQLEITRKSTNIAVAGEKSARGTKEWWEQAFSEIGKSNDFDSIGGDPESSGGLESPYHNMVHTGIGGNMGKVPIAAADPAFWLHHCNIDRLWSLWMDQVINSGNSRLLFPSTDVGSWLDTSFPNHFWGPDNALASASVRSSLFTEELGYNYDTMRKTWTLDDIPSDKDVAEAAAPLGYSEVTTPGLRLAGSPGSVLSLNFSIPPILNTLQKVQSLRLKLSGLQQPSDSSLTYAVNLNVGEKSLPLPAIGFFAEAHGSHAEGAIGLSLNAHINTLQTLAQGSNKGVLELTLQDRNNKPVSIKEAVPKFVEDASQYGIKLKAVFA